MTSCTAEAGVTVIGVVVAVEQEATTITNAANIAIILITDTFLITTSPSFEFLLPAPIPLEVTGLDQKSPAMYPLSTTPPRQL
jgi:hypothetical protein